MTYWFSVTNTGQRKLFKLAHVEYHAADFVERSSPGHGVYGEHGAESIHKTFSLLQRTYCSMQPATIRLQSMLKKNIID